MSALLIFPNPADNFIELQMNLRTSKKLDVTIFNLSGQIQQQQTVSINSNFIDTKIDVSKLSSGVYILQLSDDSGHTRTEKLTKR